MLEHLDHEVKRERDSFIPVVDSKLAHDVAQGFQILEPFYSQNHGHFLDRLFTPVALENDEIRDQDDPTLRDQVSLSFG